MSAPYSGFKRGRGALAPETTFACPEPGCGGTLTRRYSPRFERYFYGCDRYRATRCSGSLGCYPNGRPLGTPAPAAVRRMRSSAHRAFDPIWKRGTMRRGAAYRWLAAMFGRDTIHIGEMVALECARVRAISKLKGTP